MKAFGALLMAIALAVPALAQSNSNLLPPPEGDIPATFAPPEAPRDFERRVVKIAMRDGVKLNTVILIPKGARRAPIILDRTPYNAAKFAQLSASGRRQLSTLPFHADLLDAGYIVALQDVRGKHGSEGIYALTRPPRGPLNPGKIDHTTDTWDSIDWLVKQVPESNGRAGMIGLSYDGFAVLMALFDPHPALKAAVPIDPMVDGWIGDDWFHNGAYRQMIMEWLYRHTSGRDSRGGWAEPRYDSYESWIEAGSAGEMARRRGVDKLPAWQRMAANPAYGPYWQGQAVDRLFAGRRLTVPLLMVRGQFDQEDPYGIPAFLAALHPEDRKAKVTLVNGPWAHGGGVLGNGASLGPIRFGGDTGVTFRRDMLIPFLDGHLKDGGKPAKLPAALSFATGSNRWSDLPQWPMSCEAGCPHRPESFYLGPDNRLQPSEPTAAGHADYLSDPAKPVTYKPRPLRPLSAPDGGWDSWIVGDQRFAHDRPDVVSFVTEVLTEPVRITGLPIAHLFASTTGTDSDWVVKLIDVLPDEVPGDATLGGYQMLVSHEILRARYRDDPSVAKPVPAGEVVRYRLPLTHVDHVFKPGHRIMVQVQSSLFPLYDRNPQTFVDNIFFAKPEDYRAQTQRIHFGPQQPSRIELPVVPCSAQFRC